MYGVISARLAIVAYPVRIYDHGNMPTKLFLLHVIEPLPPPLNEISV